VIAEISEKLRSTLNINHIYDYIYTSIDDAMHVKSFGILRHNSHDNNFLTEFNINFNIGRRANFEQNKYLQEVFTKKNEPIIVSEVKQTEYNEKTKDTIDLLEALKVDLLYPLIVKDKIVGLMVLGIKESGDMYNDEDLQVLGIIAAQSAIAIENAMLYEETKNFSKKMEEEVKRATVDLRTANEKLKKLDAAKSEFISIASHQLRTPLTVIKGYISMMVEGSFGPLSNPIKDSLEKVYTSNERLISLVENLLNISRIESGRLKFNYQTLQFEDVVGSVVEELTNNAKDKGIDLEFKKSKNNLAKVTIDVEKIRQVLMNLIDNAIKYTDKGSVLVTLDRKNDNLVFCVKDNGMGILPDDLPKLFKKFVRGQNAMLTHTEGTGLGLFVAKQMIESHKGKIWADSEGENKGARFCFELPIVAVEEG
jgi:signal transduction histidine kinase